MEQLNILEVRKLNKSFKGKKVLNDVTFNLKRGEIVGFIGPNGAGKTTTMKCICNLIFPDSGEIFIDGFDLVTNRNKAISKLAAVIENPGLFSDLTGRENIEMISELKGINKNRTNEIVEFVGIGKNIDKKTSTYSMGMKQRLGLGIAIISKPSLLILDEPTNGLDPTGVMVLRSTLKDLVNKEGITILFSSHQLGEVEKLADRLIFIDNGIVTEIPDKIHLESKYLIKCSDISKTYEIINNLNRMLKPEIVLKDTVTISISTESEFNQVIHCLIKSGIDIHDIIKESFDIESIYKVYYGDKYE